MKNHLKSFLGICVLASALSAFAETHFDRAFAPEDGLVSRYEEPARAEICLNGSWKFQGDNDTSAYRTRRAAIGRVGQNAN